MEKVPAKEDKVDLGVNTASVEDLICLCLATYLAFPGELEDLSKSVDRVLASHRIFFYVADAV
jgi:hypothetical protein